MFRAAVWPFKITSQGDFKTGGVVDVVRSDVKTVLQTRRFIDLNVGGERRMRPGAFGEMPFVLLDPFDPSITPILIQDAVREALTHLTRIGKITVTDIRLSLVQEDAGVRVTVRYAIPGQETFDSFELSIATDSPVDSKLVGSGGR